MIRINMAADLEDMFGGQTDFEVSILLFETFPDGGEPALVDIIGAGHTLAEALVEARETLKTWRGGFICEYPDSDCINAATVKLSDGTRLCTTHDHETNNAVPVAVSE